jgi:hypothetical protein
VGVVVPIVVAAAAVNAGDFSDEQGPMAVAGVFVLAVESIVLEKLTTLLSWWLLLGVVGDDDAGDCDCDCDCDCNDGDGSCILYTAAAPSLTGVAPVARATVLSVPVITATDTLLVRIEGGAEGVGEREAEVVAPKVEKNALNRLVRRL